MKDKKAYFIGSCVENPFNNVEILCEVIDKAREISKNTFLKNCFVEEEIKKNMRQFPNDYCYYKNKRVYFYTWSAIEHFYIQGGDYDVETQRLSRYSRQEL